MTSDALPLFHITHIFNNNNLISLYALTNQQAA